MKKSEYYICKDCKQFVLVPKVVKDLKCISCNKITSIISLSNLKKIYGLTFDKIRKVGFERWIKIKTN